MNQTTDMGGLTQDLNRQLEYNKRHGGPSDALKRLKKRPDNKNWRIRSILSSSEAYREGWELIFGKKKTNKRL